jgi:FMN phosphatase YigB (HAD superfamily)
MSGRSESVEDRLKRATEAVTEQLEALPDKYRPDLQDEWRELEQALDEAPDDVTALEAIEDYERECIARCYEVVADLHMLLALEQDRLEEERKSPPDRPHPRGSSHRSPTSRIGAGTTPRRASRS